MSTGQCSSEEESIPSRYTLKVKPMKQKKSILDYFKTSETPKKSEPKPGTSGETSKVAEPRTYHIFRSPSGELTFIGRTYVFHFRIRLAEFAGMADFARRGISLAVFDLGVWPTAGEVARIHPWVAD